MASGRVHVQDVGIRIQANPRHSSSKLNPKLPKPTTGCRVVSGSPFRVEAIGLQGSGPRALNTVPSGAPYLVLLSEE